MKRIFFLIAVASCFSIHSRTQAQLKPVLSFSLKEAQDYAYANNYDLKNSAYDVQIAKKMVRQNTAIGLPQMDGGIDYIDYLARRLPTSLNLSRELYHQANRKYPLSQSNFWLGIQRHIAGKTYPADL